jgi:hypothetical protein
VAGGWLVACGVIGHRACNMSRAIRRPDKNLGIIHLGIRHAAASARLWAVVMSFLELPGLALRGRA